MDNDRIDFSELDPKRDSARFERMVHAVMAGLGPTVPSVHPFVLDVVNWGRTAALIAVLVALTSWMPVLMNGSAAPRGATITSDPVDLVSSWAQADQVPSDVDVAQVLARLHGN